ncbi:Cys-tRNA(Pro) deacylase [Jonesiaceae bacterium BS-20]|uniref:Cys-tRNA(Pro)/Cys-tRNA(Cys) deacylase n=1 Tax=Jonesiaceae bacterium BS-20 TaxID=3120821 RepID=A0AAU7DTB2_9MICO
MAKKKKQGSSGTPALVLLEKTGTEHTLHPYEHNPNSELSYGLEAAQAIGANPEQVFKTLLADVDGKLIVGIVPVNKKLDLKALASAVGGKKAAMADHAVAERATGYVVGGISPLGQKTRHATVLDTSALEHDLVYVSGGRRGLDVGLSPSALVELTGAKTELIARD